MSRPCVSSPVIAWAWLAGFTGMAAAPMRAADPAPLEFVQTIDLKGPPGKLDHFALDTKRDRLLVANQVNDSLDVVDLKAGKLLKQVPGQKGISGVAYVPN